jgi:CHASE2 domain-containing sensor protein
LAEGARERESRKQKAVRPARKGNASAAGGAGVKRQAARRPHWGRIALVCALSCFFAFAFAFVRLFNFFFTADDRLQRKFIAYMGTYVVGNPGPKVFLILAEENPQNNGSLGAPGPSWRQYHAKVVDALVKAKARVIAFDLSFDAATEFDAQLAQAFERAKKSGTRIIIGAEKFDTVDGNLKPRFIPTQLKDTLTENNWGMLDVGGMSGGTSIVRKYKLARERPDSSAFPDLQQLDIVPSLALQMVLQAQEKPLKAIFDPEKGEIQFRDADRNLVKSFPVDHEMSITINLRDRNDQTSIPYNTIYENLNDSKYFEPFAGNVVMIGFKTRNDEHDVSEHEKRYGVELHANVFSNLVQAEQIRPSPALYHYSLIAFMVFIAFLLETRLKPWADFCKVPIRIQKVVSLEFDIPLLVIIVVLLYALVPALIYMRSRYVFDFSYHIFAFLFTYLLFWAARRKRVSA